MALQVVFEYQKNKVPGRMTPSGSRRKEVFTVQHNADGSHELVKTGEMDLAEDIQSYSDGVSFDKLIERFHPKNVAEAASLIPINYNEPQYVDVSGLSEDPQILVEQIKAAKLAYAARFSKNGSKTGDQSAGSTEQHEGDGSENGKEGDE